MQLLAYFAEHANATLGDAAAALGQSVQRLTLQADGLLRSGLAQAQHFEGAPSMGVAAVTEWAATVDGLHALDVRGLLK